MIARKIFEGDDDPEMVADSHFTSAIYDDADEHTVGRILEVGVTYRSRGDYVSAERLFAGAVLLAKRVLGDIHLGTIVARRSHCEVLHLLGRSEPALAATPELKALVEGLNMPEQKAHIELNEASILERLRRYEAALEILDAVPVGLDPEVDRHRALQRAGVLKWLKRYDEAVAALGKYGLNLDEDDVSDFELTCAYMRADILLNRSPTEALEIIGRVIGLRERRLGPKHVRTLEARFVQLDGHWKIGQGSSKIPDVEALLRDMIGALGPKHPHTLATEHLLSLYRRGPPSLGHMHIRWRMP